MPSVLKAGELRLRVLLEEEIAIGPGKADLLEAIQRTGSISAAGRDLGMSYRRAWQLVDTMNRCFREPVVVAVKGGAHGGGAEVTDFGLAVVSKYRDLLRRAEQAVAAPLATFRTECLASNARPVRNAGSR